MDASQADETLAVCESACRKPGHTRSDYLQKHELSAIPLQFLAVVSHRMAQAEVENVACAFVPW